jgi:uncharacterized membrane-anchored protein
MKGRSLFLGIFICVALIQIAVSISMIVRREITLHFGHQFKFRTAPIDPYDVFRGRYVAIRVENNYAPVPDDIKLLRNRKVYAVIEEDKDGFARISRITVRRPRGKAYVQARVTYASGDRVYLRLPFNRYYLEEKVAPAAEAAYRTYSRRGLQGAYVTVRVLSGLAVIEELYVGGKPILEFVRGRK